jgi:predicted O-linked N-acetylglucosamine transferase (SPINDLY family)
VPDDAAARNALGNALTELGELDGATAAYAESARLRPGWPVPGYNLGVCRLRQGRLAEALDLLRRSVAADPADAVAHATYAGALFYDPSSGPAEILAEHRLWAARHAPAPAAAAPHPNDPDPGRPLRVGYVSPDFRGHAAAFFLRPVLAHHDPARVEAYCYAEVPAPDARTAQLRGLARGWRDTSGRTDAELVAQVRTDGIDVLVDLAGHLAGGRLRAFALRPAPVQAGYLGYPGTTGLPGVGYRLTDAVADPPGAEAAYSEELVRLPGCFCCYDPPPPLPVDPEPPSRRNGYVTFGSLHKLEKLNDRVLDLWCAVLAGVPGSRLLLARNYLRGDTADYWRGQFARRGVGPDRLLVEAPEAVDMGHLRAYARVDVALDPFPWGGHTTALEALWMGVPTVTLLGERYAGRMVASVLRHAGLGGWVARTPDEYRRVAAALAADEAGRAEMRAGLRGRLLASPLCDGAAFTRGLEDAYRALWRRWCAGQGPGPAAATEGGRP